MIRLMVDFKAGESFGDLSYYYRALIQHTYKKSEVDGERIKKTSKKSEPLVYKTDDTNSDNYAQDSASKNIQKKDECCSKEKKRVTRILYQWNYETKSHDVIHEYEDGTRETISQDKKDLPGLKKSSSAEQNSPGSTRNYSDETKEKLQKTQSEPSNVQPKSREEKNLGDKNKEEENSGIPHDHIKNDMLSIVVSPPADQKHGQNTTLFERDFSFLNQTNNKTYVSKSGRRIRYSSKNIANSTPAYANHGAPNVIYHSNPPGHHPSSTTGNPLSGSTLHKRRTAGGIEVKSSSGRRYPSKKD